MNESITRAAGASHGQEMSPARLEDLILGLGRAPRQRTTLYGTPSPERRVAALTAGPIAEIEETALGRHALGRRKPDVAAAE